MIGFKKWLYSENSSKNLLILIHPDCISELGIKTCNEYADKIKNHTKRFDYVVSHLFWPKWLVEDPKSRANRSEDHNAALDNIIATVRSVSNVVTPQNGPKDCSYNRELPEYLIDNENVNIFMAGGYEDNCLWHSYIELFEKLGWLLRERNISVQWYSPLIFQTKDFKLKPRDDDEVALDRERPELARFGANFGNFDPRKVNYGEPSSKLMESSFEVLQNHIDSLIAKHNIKHVLLNGKFPYYDSNLETVFLHRKINEEKDYWENLHEIGHYLCHHKPNNWDEEAKCEIEAWNYVKKNSIIPIPTSVVKKWDNDRIKGSWEK